MQANGIITLTTDFGEADYMLPRLKGALLCAQATQLVDITHQVEAYNIVQGAFVFKNCWTAFPKGSIHLISINDFYGPQPRFVAMEHQGHFFLGPDNGVFSLIFEPLPVAYELAPDPKSDFPLLSTYSEAVRRLVAGVPIEELGPAIKESTQRLSLRPVTFKDRIRGTVMHVDRYENVITNITYELFERIGQGRDFALFFKRNAPIEVLSQQYHDQPIGEPLCLFNASGYLELAINMGKAASLLGLKVEDTVQIDFETASSSANQ